MWLFKKKNKATATLPIPTHLQAIMLPIGNSNSELEVTGKIKCPCGNEFFEIWESNGRQIVKLLCKECKTEYIIFDSGKHGWDVLCAVMISLTEKNHLKSIRVQNVQKIFLV